MVLLLLNSSFILVWIEYQIFRNPENVSYSTCQCVVTVTQDSRKNSLLFPAQLLTIQQCYGLPCLDSFSLHWISQMLGLHLLFLTVSDLSIRLGKTVKFWTLTFSLAFFCCDFVFLSNVTMPLIIKWFLTQWVPQHSTRTSSLSYSCLFQPVMCTPWRWVPVSTVCHPASDWRWKVSSEKCFFKNKCFTKSSPYITFHFHMSAYTCFL